MKRLTEDVITQYIDEWETKRYDFKSSDYIANPSILAPEIVEKKDKKLAFDVASFANTEGGFLIIGIKDDRKNREIEGYTISDTLKNRIAQIIRNKIKPIPRYDIYVIGYRGYKLTIIEVEQNEYHISTVDGLEQAIKNSIIMVFQSFLMVLRMIMMFTDFFFQE